MKKLLGIFTLALILVACGNDDEPVQPPQAHAVDLGLSVKWADMNVGASNYYNYGGLYAWADSAGSHTTLKGIDIEFHDTEGYTKCTWSSLHYGGMTPAASITGMQCDVATYKWGSDWRTPTNTEMRELVEKCKWTPSTEEGVPGYRVTGPSGNSIFLPMAGERTNGVDVTGRGMRGNYWTATLLPKSAQQDKGYDSNVACAAWSMHITAGGSPVMATDLRCYGISLRAVHK